MPFYLYAMSKVIKTPSSCDIMAHNPCRRIVTWSMHANEMQCLKNAVGTGMYVV